MLSRIQHIGYSFATNTLGRFGFNLIGNTIGSPIPIDLFTDTAAILIFIVSNSYYGMPRGQIHVNLPPEHPIMSFETIKIKMAAVSVKRSIKTRHHGSIQPIALTLIHIFSFPIVFPFVGSRSSFVLVW